MTPSLIGANGGEKTAQFVEAWEAPERNILLRRVVSPIVSSIAIETLSVIGLLYHSLGVLVKSIPAAMELTLHNLSMQWTKNIAQRFPTAMTWSSFTASCGALGTAIKGATIGGLQALCLTGRAKCIRAYSSGIFANNLSVSTRWQKAWKTMQSNVKRYKVYYATAGVVVLALSALAFTMRPLSREEVICNIVKDLERNMDRFPEDPKDWGMYDYCQVVSKSAPYYNSLRTNSQFSEKKIQDIQQAFKEANPRQWHSAKDWAVCSIRDKDQLRLLMHPLTTAFKPNSKLPCQESTLQFLWNVAVEGYRGKSI